MNQSVPYEYCGLRFLLQWEQKERKLHRELRYEPCASQVREALRYFQVARSFKGLKDDQVARHIAKSLVRVDKSAKLSPEDKVMRLAMQFKNRYERYNLSASSKLFWLRHRSPFVLYDSRALNALRIYGYEIEDRAYDQFCVCWRQEYERHITAIRRATKRLVDMRTFIPPWHKSKKELLELSSQAWFHERVFDIYLWEHGGEG